MFTVINKKFFISCPDMWLVLKAGYFIGNKWYNDCFQDSGMDAEKKGMNPNATEFQSLYNQQGEDESGNKSQDSFQGMCT